MVQWFPGHMAKAKRLIIENMKLVDVVIELADARVPESSRNPLLHQLIGEKPRILVLNKSDLAEEDMTAKWVKYYKKNDVTTVSLNSLSGKKRVKNELMENIRYEARYVLEKRKKKGIIKKTVRTMVLGISNVGKSTLINFFAGKGAAETGDKPGVTKGKQWIRLGQDIELLDMPGILWPKIENDEVGYKLAVTGAIGERAVDSVEMALWLVNWYAHNKPGKINERYKIEREEDNYKMLHLICIKRGIIRSGGEPDLEKGAIMLLDEFRAGKLGPITLDRYIGE